jgi:hypothetical protein
MVGSGMPVARTVFVEEHQLMVKGLGIEAHRFMGHGVSLFVRETLGAVLTP